MWPLVAIIVAGAVLRVVHLGQASLWNDEFFSRYYPELGLGFLWGPGFTLETTPPPYYTLLLGWMHLFGTSEVALRAPSAIASVAAIPLVYLLAREFTGRQGALVAALVFAISPMQVYYAQEARVYALMSPPACLALLGMARWLREPGRRHLTMYAIGATVSVYLHHTAALLLLACNLALLTNLARFQVDWQRSKRASHWFVEQIHASARSALPRSAPVGQPQVNWNALRDWAACNAVIGLLCLPAAIAMLLELHSSSLSWVGPTTWRDIVTRIGDVISGPAIYPLRLNLGLGFLFCLSVASGAWIMRPDRRMVTILLLIPIIDFALILLAGLHQPVLETRILCWMGIPLSVLLGCILTSVRRARPALVIGTGAALLIGLGFQFSEAAKVKEPWQELLARLQPELAAADVVVVGPWTEPLPLLYYGQDMTKVRRWDEHLPDVSENAVSHHFLGVREISRAALLDDIRAGQRVLLIQRAVEYYYLPLLTDVVPPQRTWQQDCGRSFCMMAFYWDGQNLALR